MFATNVRNLKKNPSLALKHAEKDPVLILKGNEPNAVLVHIDSTMTEDTEGLRAALATSLYRDGLVSLGKAKQISGLTLSEFITHLASLNIEIARHDETAENETKDVSAWLSS